VTVRPARTLALLLVLAVGVIVLAACGDDDSTSTTAEVETPDEVAQAWLVSLSSADIAGVCARMTDELIATTEEESDAPCEEAFSFTEQNTTEEAVDVAESGAFTTTEETDTTATVEFETSEGAGTMKLEKVGGVWLVDELAGG
jgi:hypothetical protein